MWQSDGRVRWRRISGWNEGKRWGKVMVEWGEEEYVEEIKGNTVSWKKTSLETKIFLVAKLSTLKPLTP